MKYFRKKDLYFLCGITVLITIFLIVNKETIVEVEEYEDNVAPKIIILKNDFRFFDDEEIDYLKYIYVSDDSNKYIVNIVNEEESKKPGKRLIEIEAIDFSNNRSSVFLNVEILSKQEWQEHINGLTNIYKYRNRLNDDLIENKGLADYEAFKLAESFIGMEGSCTDVAQAYIDSYFGNGYNIFDTYDITLEEALPGDIIYYDDAGNGQPHYAVYLGGYSALQGNMQGHAVIGFVYLKQGSEPIFQRLNGR